MEASQRCTQRTITVIQMWPSAYGQCPAGPGTIATMMDDSAGGGWSGLVITLMPFLVLCVITFFCCVLSSLIITRISRDGLGIITRFMGLILTVIGAQMLLAGVNAKVSFGCWTNGISLSEWDIILSGLIVFAGIVIALGVMKIHRYPRKGS